MSSSLSNTPPFLFSVPLCGGQCEELSPQLWSCVCVCVWVWVGLVVCCVVLGGVCVWWWRCVCVCVYTPGCAVVLCFVLALLLCVVVGRGDGGGGGEKRGCAC